jgi:glycolate oxidase
MHPTIVHDHGDVEGEKRSKSAFAEIVGIAQELGGSASGEHGIGLVQKEYMPIVMPEWQLELMRGIKQVFDPRGILNPGKIF